MSNNKEISKMTLQKVKDGEGLKVKFKEASDAGGAEANDDRECKGLVHPDLKGAMNALAIHWALLSGLIKIGEVPDIAMAEHPILEKIHINGYSIGGDDETQGVIISGHYQTWRNKAQQLNTPFERFEGSPEARYVYMDDLQAKLRNLDLEGHAYLSGEKRGTKPTGEAKDEKPVDKNQGNLFPQGMSHAAPDAMERVAAMDSEGSKASKKRSARKSNSNGQKETEPA